MKNNINKNIRNIAKLIGGIEVDWFKEKVILFPYDQKKYTEIPKEVNISNYHSWAKGCTYDELRFHENLDLLMSVVVEIENMGFSTKIELCKNPYSTRKDKMQHWCQLGRDQIFPDIYGSSYNEDNLTGKVEAVYQAVVKFAEYNLKQKK